MTGVDKTASQLKGSERQGSGRQEESLTLVKTGAVVEKQHRVEKEAELSDKELPEPIRPSKKMPGLPPIGISQVKDMLCSPSMPEQKIMKLVASKLTSGAYDSDDAGSDGGSVVGMQGLFDCILETTLYESDHSDEDSADEENSPRELPCAFCSKVFLSNMRLKTHVLVMHSLQDPSLLNMTHVAPRRELQRSLSNSKTGSPDVARPLSQGTMNVEVTDASLVKHLPPKQRVKVSPKARAAAAAAVMPSKDQAVTSQATPGDALPLQPSGAEAREKVSESTPQTAATGGEEFSSPKESGDSRVSTQGEADDLAASTLSTEPRLTRLRRRSSALKLDEQSSSSSSSSTSSPSPSLAGEKTTRSSHRQQAKLNKPPSSSPSSLPAPKRKSTDSSPVPSSVTKKPKSSDSAPASGKQHSAPSRRSR